ncbi:DNA-directed RNA polymerase subunit A' [Candidatus Altiarchaeales archaeon WOR_SM1_SCG]|nr:DNA-directed RNA polymerase subunit A' [Candidatus Altiarchaeales archaeon WOR_SM1_SCG]
MIIRKKIGSIEFGLLSPKQIRRISAAKIFTPNTYDDDGYPIEGGLMEPRLGIIDPGLRCKTCGGRLGECMGHFGYAELTRPVVHVGYAKEIYNLLKSTCRSCGRLLISENGIKEYIEKGLTPDAIDEIWKKTEKVSAQESRCPFCGEIQKKLKFVRPYSYYEVFDGIDNKLLVSEIREWFEKIPDEDMEKLGMKIRPEWLILKAVPVLPITARPSITLESSDRSEDDLTHKLVDILRISQRLEENINSGAPQLVIEDLWDLLQYHVATYFNNGISGVPPARHRSGRPLKTLAQRLKAKEGRFRNNLSGKRVNFSARTVVGPDPNLSINEVGVPEAIARELTISEEVNETNIKQLKKLILNGPDKHPGALNVISPDGKRKRILEQTKKAVAKALDVGDILERHLNDGDVVIFNRQPSLHRISMMAHRVKVLPYKTFRINTCVCSPYNADFDGDEMNLHVPQSEEARAEAEILMKVQESIISPRFSMPFIGGRHDHVTGMYFLTKKDAVFNREDALQLTRGILKVRKGKDNFTGKELFSLLLPGDLDVEYRGKLCDCNGECKKRKCPDEGYVIIKNGKLKYGIIDSEGMEGILLNEIFLKYGSDAAREFIDNSTLLATRMIMKYGFSTGIDDQGVPAAGKEKINKLLTDAEKQVDVLIDQYNKKILEAIPGKTLVESLEAYIMEVLGNSRTDAGNIAAGYAAGKSPAIMAKSGARGSLLNITQMAGSVGQQAVRGSRIKRGYFDRTLSHYKKGDVSAEANGFVRSNFKDGTTPTEYFFHAMGGREGLVDTAVRTSRSGYMQRRLINALLDLKTCPDRSVRGDGGVIVQFLYGDDGIDPMKRGYLEQHEHKEFFT